MKKLMLLLLFVMPLSVYAQGKRVSELDPISTLASDDDLYIVDTSEGTAGSKKITLRDLLKTGETTVLVASSTAPANVQLVAPYVCDGTDDQVEIQQAIDSVASTGGTVVLTEGVFNISMVTSRLTGTGDIADSNTDHFKVDVGSDYSSINVGDILIVRDGLKSGSYTMQYYNCDGPYVVDSKSASGLGATEVQCTGYLDGPYVGATYIRPAYGITVPPSVTLRGSSKLTTFLKRDAGETGVVLHLSAPISSSGAQQLYNFTVHGNSTNQSGDWWEYIGLSTGAAYDVHSYGLEVRYCRGYGLVVGQGWGYRHYGGWIEDCQVGLVVQGRGTFLGLKCLSNGVTTATGAANVYLMANYARFVDCELRSQNDATAAVSLRGAQYPIFVGCELGTETSGDCIFEALNYDSAKSPTALTASGNRYDLTNTGDYLVKCTYWLLGAHITGTLRGNPTTLIYNYDNYAHGIRLDLGSATYGMDTGQEVSQLTPCVNGTGVSAVAYTTYVWDETGTKLEYRLPSDPTDVSRFAGIHDAYPTPNGTEDYLIDRGYARAKVDATVAIAIGDLLSMDTSNYGYLKKANPGEIAYAVALEAQASGQNDIDVLVVSARVLETWKDVNVKDYGAIGDGSTDDTTAIQTALAAGKGKIYFPQGTYLLTGTLEPDPNATLIFDNAILDFSTQTSFVGSSNIYVASTAPSALPAQSGSSSIGDRSFTFSSAHGLSVGDIIYAHDSNNSSYSNFSTAYQKRESFVVTEVTSTTAIETNRPAEFAWTAGSGIGWYKYSGESFSMEGPVKIIGNPSSSSNTTNILVVESVHPRFVDVVCQGAYQQSISISRSYDVKLDRCHVIKEIDDIPGTSYGVSIGSCQDVRVTDCTLHGDRHGITVGGTGLNINVVISNCTLSSRVQASGDFHGNTIHSSFLNCRAIYDFNVGGNHNSIKGCFCSATRGNVGIGLTQLKGFDFQFMDNNITDVASGRYGILASVLDSDLDEAGTFVIDGLTYDTPSAAAAGFAARFDCDTGTGPSVAVNYKISNVTCTNYQTASGYGIQIEHNNGGTRPGRVDIKDYFGAGGILISTVDRATVSDAQIMTTSGYGVNISAVTTRTTISNLNIESINSSYYALTLSGDASYQPDIQLDNIFVKGASTRHLSLDYANECRINNFRWDTTASTYDVSVTANVSALHWKGGSLDKTKISLNASCDYFWNIDLTGTPQSSLLGNIGSRVQDLATGLVYIKRTDNTTTNWTTTSVVYSTADVSNPPTAAELNAEFGAPGTVGAGFKAIINDNDADTNFWNVISDGTSWWYFAGTKAA